MLDDRESSNTKFGFLVQTKGNLSRVDGVLYDARGPILDEVSRRETFATSFRIPAERSAAGSRKKRPEGVLYGLAPSLPGLRWVRQQGAA